MRPGAAQNPFDPHQAWPLPEASLYGDSTVVPESPVYVRKYPIPLNRTVLVSTSL